MLFDPRPKSRRKDLYDRDRELGLLLRGLRAGEGLIVVYGLRRIGKTSLVRVGLGEAGAPYVSVDARRYMATPSLLSPRVIALVVEEALRSYRKVRGALGKALERVESLDLKVLSIRTGRRRKALAEVLEEADEWAGNHGTRFVVLLDEAQELRVVPAWRSIFAWVLDNLNHITFIATGSEVGVLRGFLSLEDPSSPLFGRPRLEIALDRFTQEEALGFLEKGFREIGVEADVEELADAVERLDGIAGWLTLYGHYRATYGLSHREALARVEEEAARLVAEEIWKLAKYSPQRYLAVLQAIALGLEKWSNIKRYAQGAAGPIPDNKLSRILQNLVKYGFIEKTENNRYRAADPLLPRAVEYLSKKPAS